jgi:hypothetical protein
MDIIRTKANMGYRQVYFHLARRILNSLRIHTLFINR